MFSYVICRVPIGFSFGFVRAGNFSEVSVNGGRREKEEISWFYTEKLTNLVNFFNSANDNKGNGKLSVSRFIK
jgi:hypothetical protein